MSYVCQTNSPCAPLLDFTAQMLPINIRQTRVPVFLVKSFSKKNFEINLLDKNINFIFVS
jgi:hypothetical protein